MNYFSIYSKRIIFPCIYIYVTENGFNDFHKNDE